MSVERENVADTPLGSPLTLSATGAENPFSAARFTAMTDVPPGVSTWLEGDRVNVKSLAGAAMWSSRVTLNDVFASWSTAVRVTANVPPTPYVVE